MGQERNLINTFKHQITCYLSRSASSCDSLIKFDAGASHHDFSFPISLDKVWKNYIEIKEADLYGNILNYAGCCDETEALEKIKTASKLWIFAIENVWIEKDVCYVNIARNPGTILNQIIYDPSYFELKEQDNSFSLHIKTSQIHNSSITQFRLEIIEKILRNLLKHAPHISLKEDPSEAQFCLLLTTRSNFKANEHNDEKFKTLLVGVVLDETTKQISQMEADEYLSQRTQDMHLIALHKFGVRIKNEKEFMELLKKLGKSAAIMDLIENKHSSSAKLNSNPKQSFFLYNSARIETLISLFNEKVEERYYAQLPPLCDINFEYLSEPLEWQVFKHLLLLPDVIEKSLGDIMNGKIAIHLLYKYLVDFTKTFSVFYSKVRILLENRSHLMPKVYAKIYLLLAIQKTLNTVLEILEIEPVKFM